MGVTLYLLRVAWDRGAECGGYRLSQSNMPVLSQKRCVLLSLLLPLSILPVLFYFREDANRVYLRFTSSVIETHVNETDRMTLDSDRRELIDVLRVPYIYLLRLCYLGGIEPTNSNYCYVPTGSSSFSSSICVNVWCIHADIQNFASRYLRYIGASF